MIYEIACTIDRHSLLVEVQKIVDCFFEDHEIKLVPKYIT